MLHDRQKLQAAIADLARYGCDLTNRWSSDGDRADDAAFHLGYLEEYCGEDLSVSEVLRAARAMMKQDTRVTDAVDVSPRWH